MSVATAAPIALPTKLREKYPGGVARCGAEFFQRAAFDLRDDFGNFLHVGGFARLPRYGTGARYGQSVSTMNRSSGVAATVSRTFWPFLERERCR